MFTVTKSYLHREMDRGAKEAAAHAEITIFVIARCIASIDMQISATPSRTGSHESIDITYNYAHLFPSECMK